LLEVGKIALSIMCETPFVLEELVISVLQFSSVQDIFISSLVNHHWHYCARSNQLWRPRVLSLFQNTSGEPPGLCHDFYKWAYILLRTNCWMLDQKACGQLIRTHGGRTAYTGVTGKNESVRTKFR
jgi:hypothetical protein